MAHLGVFLGKVVCARPLGKWRSVVSRKRRSNHQVRAEISWISSGTVMNPEAVASTQRTTYHGHDLMAKNCERKNLDSPSGLPPAPNGAHAHSKCLWARARSLWTFFDELRHPFAPTLPK